MKKYLRVTWSPTFEQSRGAADWRHPASPNPLGENRKAWRVEESSRGPIREPAGLPDSSPEPRPDIRQGQISPARKEGIIIKSGPRHQIWWIFYRVSFFSASILWVKTDMFLLSPRSCLWGSCCFAPGHALQTTSDLIFVSFFFIFLSSSLEVRDPEGCHKLSTPEPIRH